MERRFETYLGNVLVIRGRVQAFHIVMQNIPEIIGKIAFVLIRHDLPMIRIKGSPPFGDLRALFIAVDFSSSNIRPEVVERKIKQIDGVKEVRVIRPVANLLVDPYLFPQVTGNERAIIIDHAGIVGVSRELRIRIGDTARIVLFHIGYEIGKRMFMDYIKDRNLTAEEVLSLVSMLIIGYGWGVAEPVKEKSTIRVYDYWECSAIKGEYKEPQGFILKGLLTGVYESFTGKKVKVVETKCVAKGDEYCEFKIYL